MQLEISNITKVYRGGTRGVDGVTLRLGPGLIGLLGLNGAGKSSLMRVAATVTRPTRRTVLFAAGPAGWCAPMQGYACACWRRSHGPGAVPVPPDLEDAYLTPTRWPSSGIPARIMRARLGESRSRDGGRRGGREQR